MYYVNYIQASHEPKKAAALLGVDQPKVSALMRGRLSGFSTERLFKLNFSELGSPRNSPLYQTFTHHRLHAGQDVSKSSAVGGRVERLIGPNPFHNRADEC